jgi:hypothetical protein
MIDSATVAPSLHAAVFLQVRKPLLVVGSNWFAASMPLQMARIASLAGRLGMSLPFIRVGWVSARHGFRRISVVGGGGSVAVVDKS